MKKNQGKIFILSGPSGSGKTTLHKKILKATKIKKVLVKAVSATTRPKRPGERNGIDYIFMSKKEFLSRKGKGFFLETQKVHGQYYGTIKKVVQDLLKKGKNVLLCIDVKGAKVILRQFPEGVSIFVNTPSFSVLKERLRARGVASSQEFNKRVRTAKSELKEARHYSHILVNDRLEEAVNALEAIILGQINLKAQNPK